MTPRIRHEDAPQELMRAMSNFNTRVDGCGLDKALLELVKIRASQINGCAYCVHMHARIARKLGVSEERVFMIPAWRDSPLYTKRERAALGWTEAVTMISETGVPDESFTAAREEFSEEEVAKLTFAIALINSWNRLAVSFRWVHPGEAAEG